MIDERHMIRTMTIREHKVRQELLRTLRTFDWRHPRPESLSTYQLAHEVRYMVERNGHRRQP